MKRAQSLRLPARRRRRLHRWLVGIVGGIIGLWLVFEIALRWVPLPAALFQPLPASLEFVDRHGRPLREVRTGDGAFHRRVSYEDLPQSLIDATVAAEDKRFWTHEGVDWRASFRAVVGLVKNRRIISGGSTIPQQLIKLSEPRPRTLRTKVIEAAQAMRLEQVWTKQRILAEYMNRLDYGNLTTGPAEAAQHYFGKPLRDLSAAEAALLAGLPQSPGRLNPRTHFLRAQKRQQWILSRLERNGHLTLAERERAVAQPLQLADARLSFEAPHFVDLVLRCLDSADSQDTSHPKGAAWTRNNPALKASNGRLPGAVHTTVDLDLNRFVERLIRHQVEELRDRNVHDGAAVVIENRTGDVLALVGSANYFSSRDGQVNGAWAPRSAGSTLKPFTYLLAFEHGATPASIVEDLPAEFVTATGLFVPENYNRRCYGPMTYRQALANSLNISAVKVLRSVGGPLVLQQRLQNLGLTTLDQPPEYYGLGLTLGNAEVRLLELANAYAALARLGEYRPWRWIQATEPASERGPEEVGERSAGQKLPQQAVAWLIADILSDNNARTLAFGVDSNLRFDFPVACKTGTSSDFRDNWALGFTPEFTVGVWMGNFDGSPMRGVSGVSGAAPVLHEVFDHLHERFGTTWFARPTNIVERFVHPLTGKLQTSRIATDAILEKFLVTALPPADSPSDYDASGRVRLPAAYGRWLASGDNWLGDRAVMEDSTPSQSLRLVSPQPGTTFFLDPDLPLSSRAIPLRAEGGSRLQWESESLECRAGLAGPVAVMREGRHKLTVMCRETGQRVETWVLVKGL